MKVRRFWRKLGLIGVHVSLRDGCAFFMDKEELIMQQPSHYRNPDALIDIDERPGWGQWLGLSLQHLFSMFGSTVLVPILVGLNPGIALFSSGVGTLMS